MKKTIVALAVAAVAATSANAATVYNQDGTKVDVNGSVRLILKKEKNERGDLVDNGSRVSFKASHDLGEGLSALAYTELRFSKNVTVQVKDPQGKVVREYDVEKLGNNVHVKRLYAGFAYEGLGTLTFGNQLTIGDDVGVSDYTYFLGGINNLLSSGEKAINFKSAEFNGFTFGGAYVFSADADKQAPRDGRGFVVAGLYNRKMGDVGFALEAGYSSKKIGDAMLSVNQKAWTVGGELSYQDFAVAVDYSQVKSGKLDTISWRGQKHPGKPDQDDSFHKVREVELGLKYQFIPESKIYTDFIWGKAVTAYDRTVRLRAYIAGVDYKFHKNVVTYLEGGVFRYKHDNDLDPTLRDKKLGVGLRVFF
ncbi:porin [Pasteurella multocida]|nr:porin [Pasteurella multocida]